MKRIFLLILFILIFFSAAHADDSGTEAKDSVLLNSGYEMPLRGIDFSSLTPVQAENAVYLALKQGFRLIDIAGSHGNEEAVGRAIQKAIEEKIVSREEIFVTAAIWLEIPETEEANWEELGDAAVQQSLETLRLEYIDLMILNQSRYDADIAAYQAIERAVNKGLIRSIGLSGFSESRNFDLILCQITTTPAVLQIETHPYRQNLEMKEHLAQYGTVLEAKDPLGDKDDRAVLFADPAVSVLATWHQKTSDQIVLRWHLQSGNIAIPSAADEARLEEYFNITDFELDNRGMEEINALDRTLSYVYY